QHAGASPGAGAREHIREVAVAHEPERPGIGKGELEFVEREYRGEIEQRARRAGGRDAVDAAYVAPRERAHAVDHDARPAPRVAARNGDVDRPVPVQEGGKAPEPRGGVMAHDAPGAAREDGCQLGGSRGRHAMANGVDAAVVAVQPAGTEPPLDRLTVVTGGA